MEILSKKKCMAKDIGNHGNLFGGYLMAWFDESAAILASETLETPYVVTRFADMEFIEPIKQKDLVDICGEVSSIGTTSITISMEARKKNPYNTGEFSVAAKFKMVFVHVNDRTVKQPIPKSIKDKIKKK